MAGLTNLLRFQWRAYWRRYARAGRAGAASLVILTTLFFALASKYVPLLRAAARGLEAGDARRFERALLWAFVAWLFPLWEDAQLSIAPRRLLHLPLDTRALASFRLASLLIPPTSWIVIAVSLAALYPALSSAHPFTAALATLLFVASAAATGFALAHLFAAVPRRLTFALALLAALGLFAIYSVRNSGGATNFDDAARVVASVTGTPTRLVARAATGQGRWAALAGLCVFLAAAVCLALWSFGRSLRGRDESRGRASKRRGFTLPGRLGGLVAKDCRYFGRLLDPYLGWLVALAYCASLAASEAAEPKSLLVVLLLVFVPNSILAFNCFGLDRQAGLDRYALLPTGPRSILLAKNAAYLLLAGAQAALVVFAAGLKFGSSVGLIGAVAACAFALCYLACGNVLSVARPFKMRFYRPSSGGLISDYLIALTLSNLPALAFGFTLYGAGGLAAAWRASLLLSFCAAAYAASLSWAARRFESRFETLRELLA